MSILDKITSFRLTDTYCSSVSTVAPSLWAILWARLEFDKVSTAREGMQIVVLTSLTAVATGLAELRRRGEQVLCTSMVGRKETFGRLEELANL